MIERIVLRERAYSTKVTPMYLVDAIGDEVKVCSYALVNKGYGKGATPL